MAREVKLNKIDTVLVEFEYPVTRQEVVETGDDVTLILAEGTVTLGEIVEQSGQDVFDSRDDLANEVMNLLPQHAVGEPYQSEGEG